MRLWGEPFGVPMASSTKDGLMSKEDKENIDDGIVATGADPVVAAVASTLTVAGEVDGDVVYTAKVAGVDGDDITITHLTPAVASAATQVLKPFGVTVADGTDILVQLAGTLNGAKATGLLTIAGEFGNFDDGDTVTIGSAANERVYRAKTAPEQIYDFDIAEDKEGSLYNLAQAIAAYGPTEGSAYFTGTPAHPLFTATGGATAMTLTALLAGVAANDEATTDVADDASWGAGVTAGGLDADLTITTTGAMVVAGITGASAALVTAVDENAGGGLAGVAAEAPLAGGADGTVGEDGEMFVCTDDSTPDERVLYLSVGESTAVESNWFSVVLAKVV